MSCIDGFAIPVPTASKPQFIAHVRHFDALRLALAALRMISRGFTPVIGAGHRGPA